MPGRRAHTAGGVLAGSISALCLSANQRPTCQLVEIAGGALSGGLFGRLPDILEPATSPRHRRFAHAVMPGFAAGFPAVCHVGSWQRDLRARADRRAVLRQQTADGLLSLWHGFVEFLLRLLAGAIPGAIAGYWSHLLLDARTPNGLPLIA